MKITTLPFTVKVTDTITGVPVFSKAVKTQKIADFVANVWFKKSDDYLVEIVENPWHIKNTVEL